MSFSVILARLGVKGAVTLGGVDSANKLVKLDTDGLIDVSTMPADISAHVANTSNPHSVTKTQVGLGNCDNTSDVNKPISTLTQTALDLKADDTDLAAHTADATIHITSGQNSLLDALTATAVELNYVAGVTSSIQTQLDTNASGLSTHVSDATIHITSGQNSLLDALTATAAELNHSVGVTSAIQTQIDALLPKAGGTMTGALTLTLGELNTAVLTGSQTWNNVGITCRGIEHAITDTASAAESTAFRLMGGAAGTTPLLSVRKDGKTTVAGSLVVTTIDPVGNCTLNSYGYACVTADVNYGVMLARGNYTIPSATGGVQWLNPGTYTAETLLHQPTTGVLDARAGATAVSIRAYGTYTDASNYERLSLVTAAGDCEVITEALGTGTRRNIKLNGANRAAYDAAPSTTTIRDILISHGLMAAS